MTIIGIHTHNAGTAFPDATRIVKLVRSHVVAGKHDIRELASRYKTVQSVAGTPISIDGWATPIRISWTSAGDGHVRDANVVCAPIDCSNALIYVLDQIERE